MSSEIFSDASSDTSSSTRTLPTHHADRFRLVLFIVAAHGYPVEAAAAMLSVSCSLALRDLRDDGELLGLTALVASRIGRETLLARAVRRGDAERTEALLEACLTPADRAALLAAVDVAGATPLQRAATREMATVLLDAGAAPPMTAGAGGAGAGGDDGLAWAVSAARACLVEALLERVPPARRAARVNAVDAAGRTLLDRARKRCVAQLLLDAGAAAPASLDMDDWDAVEQTRDHPQWINWQVLGQLEQPRDEQEEQLSDEEKAEQRRLANLAGESGVTLLMFPQEGYSTSMLLDAGADQFAVDDEWRDAFDYAMDYDTDPDSPHGSESLGELFARLPSAAARKQRVNRADVHGRTLLMRASYETVGILLRAGASVWARDCDGHDALWHALMSEWTHVQDVVPILLKAMAKNDGTERRRAWINTPDDSGVTPLMLTRSPDAAKALLAAGADLAAVDHEGRDAFDHVTLNFDDNEFDDLAWHLHKVFIQSVPSKEERCRLRRKHGWYP